MKAILEMMDFHNTDKYIKSPEQLQAEQQHSMQMQIQGMMLEDQMKAKEQQRDIMGDVIKQIAAWKKS